MDQQTYEQKQADLEDAIDKARRGLDVAMGRGLTQQVIDKRRLELSRVLVAYEEFMNDPAHEVHNRQILHARRGGSA